MGTRAVNRQMILNEMAKCMKSPEYFLETYGYVRHPTKGYIKFKLWEYQRESIRAFKEHRFNITLKSRQVGITTITAGYVAWLMTFFTAKEIACVANKQENAQGFIRKVKLIFKKLPPWLRPKIISDNKHSIELSNGSKVTAHATTSDAARSEALALLFIDEAAAIDESKVQDLWGAAYPTLSTGGAAIIAATPKGVGNFYHKQWLGAKNGVTDFHPLVINWTQNPEYSKGLKWKCKKCGHIQEEGELLKTPCPSCGKILRPTSPWYEDMSKNLNSERLVAQELDMNFLGSGDNVIGEEYIDKLEGEIRKPIRIAGKDKNLWIWEEPIEGEEYLISADVARGDGTDNSAFHVFRLSSLEQVAEYYSKIPPDLYAKVLNETGLMYNNALIVVEINSLGIGTALKLEELEYPNLFHSYKGQFNPKKMERVGDEMNQETLIPGFQTTNITRPLIVSQLEQDIRNNKIRINSSRLLDEIRTFIWKNGKPEAMHGCNDDLCISAAIGLFIIEVVLKSIVASKQLLEISLREISSALGMGEDIVELNKNFNKNMKQYEDVWTMKNMWGESEDLKWLLDK